MLVLCIVSGAAALQSAIGFGMGLIAAPLLLLVAPELVPGPLVLASVVLTGLSAYRDREHIDLRGMGAALAGRAVGTLAAAIFLSLASASLFNLTFGGMVMLAAVLSAAGARFVPTRTTSLVAGSASGLMGTISAIGGPPMALIYQHSDSGVMRGTLAGYFVLGTAFTLVALWWVGLFGEQEALLGLILMPAMALGFGLGHLLNRGISPGLLRILILGLSFASGLFVFLRTAL